ncbi:hypothetical protein CAPN006_07620 [Capnocytophaga canimorsus]|nr:hypothetical protein CAPN006_07620 [Capnocytophaga canimorsus]
MAKEIKNGVVLRSDFVGVVAVTDALFGVFRAERIRNTDDDRLIFLKDGNDLIVYERRLYLFYRNYALSIGIGSMYDFIL